MQEIYCTQNTRSQTGSSLRTWPTVWLYAFDLKPTVSHHAGNEYYCVLSRDCHSGGRAAVISAATAEVLKAVEIMAFGVNGSAGDPSESARKALCYCHGIVRSLMNDLNVGKVMLSSRQLSPRSVPFKKPGINHVLNALHVHLSGSVRSPLPTERKPLSPSPTGNKCATDKPPNHGRGHLFRGDPGSRFG